jgi:hypothetical protein
MKNRKLMRFSLLTLALFHGRAIAAQEAAIEVNVDWNKLERISQTTATLQVVVNPPLRPGTAIHDRAWENLRKLAADDVRFVPWYPYPKLGVAELEPPTAQTTSWDFSLIDPLTVDFFRATSGHPVMLNFSTIPQWMFETKERVAYPADPNEVSWSYEQGTELRDSTGQEVADYFARLASWYVQGGFTDELGRRHVSPHHYKIDYWEVLNEPEYEHALTAESYTRLYDAVVAAVRRVSPETQFVGMSLAEPMRQPAFFEYFLNPANHRSGIPPDVISYHFYAVPTADQTPEIQQYTFFEQADKFLTAVRFIESIRQRLSPKTKTDVNETGCILPRDIGQGVPAEMPAGIPPSYWNLCGAMFAYLYAGLVREGIDVVGSSQLLGYPTQFPSVTMLDWQSGQPNARYWVLQLLKNNFGPQDHLVATKLSSPQVFAQAFITRNGERKLLLVNKRDRTSTLAVSGATGGVFQRVDQTAGPNPPASATLDTDYLTLNGLSVAVLTYPATR